VIAAVAAIAFWAARERPRSEVPLAEPVKLRLERELGSYKPGR